jgi:hypothetical protein
MRSSFIIGVTTTAPHPRHQTRHHAPLPQVCTFGAISGWVLRLDFFGAVVTRGGVGLSHKRLHSQPQLTADMCCLGRSYISRLAVCAKPFSPVQRVTLACVRARKYMKPNRGYTLAWRSPSRNGLFPDDLGPHGCHWHSERSATRNGAYTRVGIPRTAFNSHASTHICIHCTP